MALFKLDYRQIYRRAIGLQSPHQAFASGVARWLKRVAEALDGRGYCFEGGSAQELAGQFERFADGHGSNDELSILWNDLMEFGEQEVTLISGREKAICEVPHLPDSLSC